MNKVYLIGDSHAGVYGRATYARGADVVVGGPLGAATNFWTDFFTVSESDVEFRPELAERNYSNWKRMVGLESLRTCRQSLAVSIGLSSAPFYGHPMWRQLSSTGGNVQYISAGLLDQMIADLQQHTLRFLSFCHQKNLLFAIIAGPPPQRRHRAVSLLGAERTMLLHRRYQEPVRKFAESNGIPVVELEQAADEQGLLLAEYWGDDSAHGNTAYGSLVVEAIVRLRALSPGVVVAGDNPSDERAASRIDLADSQPNPLGKGASKTRRKAKGMLAAVSGQPIVGVLGSCRVYTPLGIAGKQGALTRRANGIFGYIHNPAEVVQAIKVLRGGTKIEPELAKLMSVQRSLLLNKKVDLFDKNFGDADLVVIELSSVRVVRYRGHDLQIHHVRNLLVEAGIGTPTCSLETIFAEREARIEQAKLTGSGVGLELACALVREGQFFELSADEIDELLKEIRDAVTQPILFVGPFVDDFDGRPIPQRQLLKERMARFSANTANTRFVDPTPYIHRHGYRESLRDSGHYRKSFEPSVAKFFTAEINAFLGDKKTDQSLDW